MPRIDAPAKINWTLEVLGRRPDGYHAITSVMATLSLADTIEIEPSERWQIDVEADAALVADLAEHGNIMERAVAEAAAGWHRASGAADAVAVWPPEGVPAARIRLIKRIPAAAGLGGGSSDAAATLQLVSAYWASLQPDAPDARQPHLMLEMAARIGSDVSFFFSPMRTALVEGRGEQMTVLPAFARQWLVLLAPPITLSRKTATLYGLLRTEHFSDGSRSRQLARTATMFRPRPVPAAAVVNVFDAVAEQAFPGLADYRRSLSGATGALAHLCGAGPALFASVADQAAAQQAATALTAQGLSAFAVSTPW